MKDSLVVIRTVSVFCALFLLCAGLVACGAPWVFEMVETLTRSPLAFEGELRVVLFGIHALLLLLGLGWVLVRGSRIHWVIWNMFLVSFLSLGVIFFGDRTHVLMEEYSWIRYTTSTFLFLAAACALGMVRQTCIQKSRILMPLAWGIVAGGLVYAGLDELMQIHEWIERTFALRGTDYVTGGYVAGAIIAAVILIRSRIVQFHGPHRISATLLIAGVVTYAASVFVDAVDSLLLVKLRSLANVFVSDPRFVMSDAWTVVSVVKNSTNGLEEVFEHTAAVLFFLAFATTLFRAFLDKGERPRSSRVREIGARALVGISLSGTVLLIALSIPLTFPSSAIAEKGITATPIASYFDGLFHVDELAFHPAQGVIIANEGRGNVFRYKDGILRKVPDSEKHRDADSVFTDASGVYVADGNGGVIARLQDGKTDVIASRKDGLVHPEALVHVGDDFYILDESQSSISRFTPGKKLEIWKPKHPDWKSPEGIAYDPMSKRLFVVDDSNGAVLKIEFGKSIEKIAQTAALDDIHFLKDGSALLADNGWGAVFRLYPDGNIKKLVQFRRMYRDLQGITVDDKGTVYVTTADGHESSSFMPSHLFRIEGLELY